MRNINIIALVFLCIAFFASGLLYYVTRPKGADYLVYELDYPSISMIGSIYFPDTDKPLSPSHRIETVNLLDGYKCGDTVKVEYKIESAFDRPYQIYLIIQKPHNKEEYLDIINEQKFKP